MSSQAFPMQQPNRNEIGFDAFNYQPGQDQQIRWLNRPNQQVAHQRYPSNVEKFRITFDAENFQPDQIKIYIQNGKLTLTGVYEERTEGCHMQKQFEKSFDVPHNADVELMACYITPAHMLVVEIPINHNYQPPVAQTDFLNINPTSNDGRRLSFSLNKFNTMNNQGLPSMSDSLSPGPSPGQQVRRTSITRTTTTTTGSTTLPPEATELLRSADITTGGTQTYTSHVTERRPSNMAAHQIIIDAPAPATSTTNNNQTTSHTILSSADLAGLPINIPPELLALGGTITIQKRKVSVTRTGDPNAVYHT